MCIHACMYVFIHKDILICMSCYRYVDTCVCRTCIHAYLHRYMHVHICMYMHTSTYLHIVYGKIFEGETLMDLVVFKPCNH